MKAPNKLTLLAAALATLLLAACSTTRRVPEGDHLYTGLKGVDYKYSTDTTAHIPDEVQ